MSLEDAINRLAEAVERLSQSYIVKVPGEDGIIQDPYKVTHSKPEPPKDHKEELLQAVEGIEKSLYDIHESHKLYWTRKIAEEKGLPFHEHEGRAITDLEVIREYDRRFPSEVQTKDEAS